jgi:hypothetical protein
LWILKSQQSSDAIGFLVPFNKKIMKVIISMMLFVLLAPGLLAQKCRYISNTVSGLDGAIQVITSPEVFARNSEAGTVEVWAKLHRDSVMVLSFVLRGDRPNKAIQGDSILLMHGVTQLLALRIMQDAVRSGSVIKPLTIYAAVSPEDFSVIRSACISTVLIQTEKDWVKVSAEKPKQEKVISHVLSCVSIYLRE